MGKGAMDFPFIIVLATQYYNIPSGLKYRGRAEKGATGSREMKRGQDRAGLGFTPLPPLGMRFFLSFSRSDPENKAQLVDRLTLFSSASAAMLLSQ